MHGDFNHAQSVPGAAPGIEHDEIASLPGGTGQVRISCIDYSPDQVSIQEINKLIGTIFIPLTFLAGIYGMNFHYFPELDQVWAYPAFWGVCLISAATMLRLFRRRNWI